MVSGDNRLHVRLSPPNCAALQRAVLLAERADLAKRLGVQSATLSEGIGSIVIRKPKGDKLSLALQSVQLRSRIRFTYKGTPRLVHPGTVRFQNYKWYLSGVEDGADLVKHFVVSEMSEIALDPPGTAAEVPSVGASPCTRSGGRSTRPREVTLRTTPRLRPRRRPLARRARLAGRARWRSRPDLHRHPPAGVPRPALRPRASGHHRQGAEVYDEMLAELRTMAGL